MSGMEERTVRYLAHRMPAARGIVVDDFARIHGGSSQETFRLRARWQEDGSPFERRLILRREPPGGLVVAERDLEYRVYDALAGQGVPVPGVHFLEMDPIWLDRPFFIMDMAPGEPGHFYASAEPYGANSDAVARNFWRHLGRLAAIDHHAVGLETLRNGRAQSDYWRAELERWEASLDSGEAVIEPIVRAAIRWLRRNPPPEPAKPAIVHGDYRPGNFLFLPDGTISAVLDWEMCHVGDPLEDVAWAIDPFWPMTRHLPLEEGLAQWSEESGMAVDRAALDWWRLFAAVKASAIWTTAEASFANGESREMVVAMTGTTATHFHRGVILDMMADRGVTA